MPTLVLALSEDLYARICAGADLWAHETHETALTPEAMAVRMLLQRT